MFGAQAFGREDKRDPGDTGFKGSAKEVSRYCYKVSYFRIHRGKKRTQGTETSKYLQEKKSTEIPLVVASERGVALKFCAV